MDPLFVLKIWFLKVKASIYDYLYKKRIISYKLYNRFLKVSYTAYFYLKAI